MKCVVLVGGEGTRLRPLTYHLPKQMLPIAEMAMIERVLMRLRSAGIDEAVLSLGYKPDAFLEAYPSGQVQGVTLRYAVEPEPLDTGGAIAFAAREAGIDDTFVAVNGDVLTDASLDELIALHRRRGAAATVALTPVEDPSAFGVVDADREGRVRAFLEKPPPGTAPTNLINAGTYVLEPTVVEMAPPGQRVSIERQIFPALAESGSLFAAGSEAYWLDTGTPALYLAAHADLLAGRRGTPPHPDARREHGVLWVLGSPVVDGTVAGASLVGSGAVVEEGALLEGATVGHDCQVAAGARIVGSVLLPGARVGEGATVESSIVGHRAIVGAGASLRELCVVGADQKIPESEERIAARVPE